jgi:tetratricopeptide (TPR) repeat protein
MNAPTRRSSDKVSRLFQRAADAWTRQEYQTTIELLIRAGRLEPQHTGIQLDLGRAYGLRYQYPAADRCFERALALAPPGSQSATLIEIGRRCQEFGHYEMATRYFERAALQNDVAPDALVVLAELYERQTRRDEAAALIQRALDRDRGFPRALLAQARLLRLNGNLLAGEPIVRSVLASPRCDSPTRARAGYELGALLDGQQRFDEAMAAWVAAKEVLRPASAPFTQVLNGIQKRIREMTANLTSDVFARWARAAVDLPPPRRLAVLCGHPRSGTTLMEQVLDSHPAALTAEETHIMHDEAYLPLSRGHAPETSILSVLDAAPAGALRNARANYFQCTELFIQRTIGDRWLIDKNPALNVLVPAVARIFPEAKLLIALRDPRDVCLSCFMQPLALNPVSSAYLTWQDTIAQYLSVMGFWRTLLPRIKNPWLEFRYESVVDDLPRAARTVFDFLGLDWDERVLLFFDHARTRPLRSPAYADVVKPVYRSAIGRWRHYEKHMKPYLSQLEPLARELGYE